MKIRLIIFILLLSAPAFGTTYYVRDDASGGGDGQSDANAFTMAEVNAFSFSTSDDVYFKCDDTFTPSSKFDINWSGVSGDHAVVGAYYGSGTVGVSGNKPILNGQDSMPSSEYDGVIDVDSANTYVDIDNIRIINSEGNGIAIIESDHIYVTACETEDTYRSGIRLPIM